MFSCFDFVYAFISNGYGKYRDGKRCRQDERNLSEFCSLLSERDVPNEKSRKNEMIPTENERFFPSDADAVHNLRKKLGVSGSGTYFFSSVGL